MGFGWGVRFECFLPKLSTNRRSLACNPFIDIVDRISCVELQHGYRQLSNLGKICVFHVISSFWHFIKHLVYFLFSDYCVILVESKTK